MKKSSLKHLSDRLSDSTSKFVKYSLAKQAEKKMLYWKSQKDFIILHHPSFMHFRKDGDVSYGFLRAKPF